MQIWNKIVESAKIISVKFFFRLNVDHAGGHEETSRSVSPEVAQRRTSDVFHLGSLLSQIKPAENKRGLCFVSLQNSETSSQGYLLYFDDRYWYRGLREFYKHVLTQKIHRITVVSGKIRRELLEIYIVVDLEPPERVIRMFRDARRCGWVSLCTDRKLFYASITLLKCILIWTTGLRSISRLNPKSSRIFWMFLQSIPQTPTTILHQTFFASYRLPECFFFRFN